MRKLTIAIAAIGLAACDPQPDVTTHPEPAATVLASPDAALTGARAGTGAQNFVGRWAAEPEWCVNPQGAQRPIEFTLQRFEGYENSCAINEIDEASGAWLLTLICQSEGQTSQEQVRAAAAGDLLTLTWWGHGGEPITFHRCSTLADTAR